MGMLEQEEEVGHTAGATFLDQRTLQVARDGIGDDAEPPDFELTHGLMVAWVASMA